MKHFYLALFSCKKYLKKQNKNASIKESHVQYLIYTHLGKKKEDNCNLKFQACFPTGEKSRTKNTKLLIQSCAKLKQRGAHLGIKSEMFAAHQRQVVLWLCATFLNHIMFCAVDCN